MTDIQTYTGIYRPTYIPTCRQADIHIEAHRDIPIQTDTNIQILTKGGRCIQTD